MMLTQEPVQPIGEFPEWLAAVEHASRMAVAERPILVIGERGTGKELIGERLHFLSHRWEAPFVKVNCAALNEELLDSELFGHEQGAFTGATKRRIGRFEQANGGTVFLDEIATATDRVQEKLLRVVEYGEYQRLGGEDVLRCDVRIVAATNVDLPALAGRGGFRADLLDRLAFDVVTLPPLRARREDIALLAAHFGAGMAREMGRAFPGFSEAALTVLEGHDWPGNVRELKNAAERATYRSVAVSELTPIEIAPDMLDPFASPWAPKSGSGRPSEPGPPTPVTASETLPKPEPELAFSASYEDAIAAFERRVVGHALSLSGGHQGKAAQALSLTYHQFRGILRKLDLDTREKRDAAGLGQPDTVQPEV